MARINTNSQAVSVTFAVPLKEENNRKVARSKIEQEILCETLCNSYVFCQGKNAEFVLFSLTAPGPQTSLAR
jgi:hypothetical protein